MRIVKCDLNARLNRSRLKAWCLRRCLANKSSCSQQLAAGVIVFLGRRCRSTLLGVVVTRGSGNGKIDNCRSSRRGSREQETARDSFFPRLRKGALRRLKLRTDTAEECAARDRAHEFQNLTRVSKFDTVGKPSVPFFRGKKMKKTRRLIRVACRGGDLPSKPDRCCMAQIYRS